EEVIERIKGVDCGGKGTSCGDQLARALTAALEAEAK
ncbi:MAG: TSCPD domain-containing protein, partial [Firmicutes bacterium]|nr:TSCPD domain-containing protein [Bacillota bacterium]